MIVLVAKHHLVSIARSVVVLAIVVFWCDANTACIISNPYNDQCRI